MHVRRDRVHAGHAPAPDQALTRLPLASPRIIWPRLSWLRITWLGAPDCNARAAAACWVPALALLVLALLSPAVLKDGDTFLHIAAGGWMIDHRAVLHTDPFSATFAGAPWTTHEWLAEIVLALAFRGAGWPGVLLLAGIAVAAAVLLLATHLRRWLPPAAVATLATAAILCTAPQLLARPHLLALPVLEPWVAGLLVARSRTAAPSWRLLPLMTLWANLHGSFLFGLLLVVPLAAEAAWCGRACRVATLRRWSLFLLGAVLASVLTPHGSEGLLFPIRLLHLQQLDSIVEWSPASFATLGPLEITLLAGLYWALSRGFRLPPVRLLLLLGLLHLALRHSRHQLLAGFVAPLLIAEPLGRFLGWRTDASTTTQQRGSSPATRRGRGAGLACAGLLATLLMAGLRLASPLARVDGPGAPISAVVHVPAALAAQPVLNDYGFGGYLIFSHLRPFIDGRADMYGDGFLAETLELGRQDRQIIAATLDRHRIAWTLLAPGNPLLTFLDDSPNWCRSYADRFAVVHVAVATGYCARPIP